jgi:hypothetical protein
MNPHPNFAPRALALAITSSLLGCVHTARPSAQPHVEYRSVEAPGTEHYEEREDETATVTVALEQLAPEYPADMIGLHLPHVVVTAKLIVDTEGRVSEARIEPPAGSDVEHPAAFDDAVRNASVRWRYTPLRIRTFEDILDAEGNVTGTRVVKDEAKPFSLDYEFDFDLRDGKPVVTSGDRPRT